MSHTAAMSCTAAVGLHYAQNCTIFDATVTAFFSPDDTIIATVAAVFISDSTHSRYGSSLAYAGLPPHE